MKIKYIFTVSVILFSLNTFAQDLQSIDSTKWLCTYNYEYLQDSTSKYSLKNDQMYLQIGSKLSKFTSIKHFLTDSALYLWEGKNLDGNTVVKEVLKSISGVGSSTMSSYRVYKNYPDKGVMFFSAYVDKNYKVEQPMKIKWKLETQKDTIILGYLCQRARTTYAGRNWTAWYSPQIPLSDGPYKFNGLPGLILKISDTKNEHCFTLNSIKIVDYPQPITVRTGSFTNITAEEFNKIKKNDLIRLYGDLQNGTITSNTEEAKAKAMHGIISKNNFIEKF